MKKLLSVFLFAISFTIVYGQITVSSKLLPAVGDVYYYSSDTTGAGIVISPAGANQLWDFKNLRAHSSNVESYIAPNALMGFSNFSNANLATQNQGANSFYRVTTKNLELLGNFISGNPFFGGANVLDKPAILLRTPLDYLDQYDYTTNQQFAISGKLIPDSLTMGITVDSIRIKIRQDVVVNVDGWGTVNLPASNWNVLRAKRITANTITVEAKLPFVGWLDITAIAGPVFGGLLNAGNIVEYVFISNDTKGFVASISVDSLGNATSASFKAQNVATKNYTYDPIAFELKSNIVSSELELINLTSESSNYSIELVSVHGVQLFAQKGFLANGSSSKINITNQSAARYEVVIRNAKGELVWKTSYLKL